MPLPDPRTIDDLLIWLAKMPPLERARVAGLLVSAETVRLLGEIRRAAVYQETRGRSYADVARELGVSESAINKAVSEHRASVRPSA